MRFTAKALCLLLAITSGCTKAGSGSDEGVGVAPPPRPQGDVVVELSGVTLGEDCGGTPPKNPPTPSESAAAAPSKTAPAVWRAPSGTGSAVPTACVPPSCGHHACQQTSIQLALRATGTTTATPIRIKKVELLDAKGVSLGELTATSPTRWSDADSYQAWDQSLAPNEQAAVSYVLSSPAWNAMEGGQRAQTGKMFQVRVTVLVGAKDRVIEKRLIQPTIMPPPMPT